MILCGLCWDPERFQDPQLIILRLPIVLQFLIKVVLNKVHHLVSPFGASSCDH